MRFGTTSYFLGVVKLIGDFKTYSIQGKKSRVILCETVLAPARPNSRKKKPLTRVILYCFGALGTQTKTYYNKGDYVLVQGRLKIFKKSSKMANSKLTVFPMKEYHLNVTKMSLVRRAKT